MRGLAAVPAAWVQQREKRDGQTHHMTFLSCLASEVFGHSFLAANGTGVTRFGS